MSTISAALVILYAKLRNTLKEFTFTYTTETDKRKTSISLWDNKNYKIEQHSSSGERLVQEGILADNEFRTIRKLLSRCNLLKMRDSYKPKIVNADSECTLFCHIYFTTKGKEKHIHIYDKEHKSLPSSFNKLMLCIQQIHKNKLELHIDQKLHLNED